MTIQQHVSLKKFNTFGIDREAKIYVKVNNLIELKSALQSFQKDSIFILGGGSNMLLRNTITEPVIHINLKGVQVIKEESDWAIVEAQAGENWHEFVLWCLDRNFGGIENLSLIPGNVGAAPIQNIGAYGVELKDSFISCTAIHTKTQKEKVFSKTDCNFGYRESVFKNELKGQYIITSIQLKLSKQNHNLQIGYGAIKSQLLKDKISNPTIKDVSNAVIAIRKQKLPDPKEIGNSGSFFKNPVISKSNFDELKSQFPDVPSYTISKNEIKIPAGWLIETAGFKGKRFGNYGVHKNQALVLVNYGGATGGEIYELALLIQKTVMRLFNIPIEMEVNII